MNLLRMSSGPTVTFEILGTRVNTRMNLNVTRWYHIALVWTSKGKTLDISTVH